MNDNQFKQIESLLTHIRESVSWVALWTFFAMVGSCVHL